MAGKDDDRSAGGSFDNLTEAQRSILSGVLRERAAQDVKFGTQDHPDVDPSLAGHGHAGGQSVAPWVVDLLGLPPVYVARERRQAAQTAGTVSWFHILIEWTSEACKAAALAQLGRGPQAAVDRCLVKVMATAMACLEARARRRASTSLHCFSNGVDCVSARDYDDAVAVLREVYGEDTSTTENLAPVPDAQEFVVALDVPPPGPDAACDGCRIAGTGAGQSSRNMHLIGCAVGAPRKRASEWAAEGRGLIFSTEV